MNYKSNSFHIRPTSANVLNSNFKVDNGRGRNVHPGLKRHKTS